MMPEINVGAVLDAVLDLSKPYPWIVAVLVGIGAVRWALVPLIKALKK
jgi:hypothetical protein